ncbi:MAG: DUF4347 domain-containing protein [Scytonema sp. PMC 1069.18]|nr:DUF4347 domain-containing protein [Scytonema sp. PMC 1069.18]MEC4884713.1 DUF4347 domain-containing protein [Scytonema sp. PMC 1070.18]
MTSIVFIDPSVNNYEVLLNNIVAGIKAVVLTSERDGVEQIAEVLSQYSELENVHIVSHGSPGSLYLGNSELSLDTLEYYSQNLKSWFSKKTTTPNLLIYGCHVASGDAGTEFITKLHQLTGAKIAASANLTGHSGLGGDWDLEVSVGEVENPALAFSAQAMAIYPSVLELRVLGQVDTPGASDDVVVVGNFAYIAANEAGLQIVDISKGEIVNSIDTPGPAKDVVVVDNYAYIAGDAQGLQVINLQNGSTTNQAIENGVANDVAVVGNTLYVAAGGAGLQIFNISDRANPAFIGSVDTPGWAENVDVVGDFAYIADGDLGLQIANISNPDTATLVGSYNTNGYAVDIEVQGNYAYIAGGNDGLQILDITNPNNPTLVGQNTTVNFGATGGWTNWQDIEASGQISLNAGKQLLRLDTLTRYFDIDYLELVPVSGNSQSIRIQAENYRLGGQNVAYYDTTPGNTFGTKSGDVDIVGTGDGGAVGAIEAGEWLTYDVDIPTSGLYKIVARIASDVTDNHGLRVSVGSYLTSGFAIDVDVEGNYAYITDTNTGLQVLDISNLNNPQLVSSYQTPGIAESIAVEGKKIYLADRELGLTILINNTLPTATDSTISITKNSVYTFSAANFNFADADSGDSLQALRITQLPSLGQLFSDANGNNTQDDGEAITQNQNIAVADISQLKFKPATDASGTNYASFQYQVSDGTDFSTIASTLSINVNPATNTVPTATNSTISIPRNRAYTFSAANFNFADADSGDSLQAVRITQLPSLGEFFLDANGDDIQDNGEAITQNQNIAVADISKLKFKPATNASGTNYANFQFQVSDGTDFSTVASTLSINVNPAPNTAPTATNSTIAINQNSVYTFSAANFNFADTDSGDSLQAVQITQLPSLGQLFSDANGNNTQDDGEAITQNQNIAVADISQLKFKPATDANGTNYASFQYLVNDGTDFSTIASTLSINVNPATNTAPTLVDVDFVAFTDADAGVPVGADGELVSSLLDAASNIIDPDADARKGLAITGVDTSKGQFFYSTNNGVTWMSLTSASDANALLLAADAQTRVYFQPNPNFSGTLNDVVSFRAWDQTTGNNGDRADTTINGGTTAFSSNTDSATLVVQNANTPVSLTLLSNSLNLFQLQGSSDGAQPRLKVALKQFGSNQVNELGVFFVDDAQGSIGGIQPGTSGYIQAALERSQVVFSALANAPNGFSTDLTRILEFESGDNLRFVLVKDGSIDEALTGKTTLANVLVGDPSTSGVTPLGNGQFSLAWKNASGQSMNVEDLVVNLEATNQALPLGAGIQGNFQGEVIDLRQLTTPVQAEFTVNREAAFDNFVGFYRIADVNGGIDTNGDGTADLNPGENGYTEAAIRGRLAGVDLSVSNQNTATIKATLEAGSLLAPFIVVNGRPEALLDNNTANNPAVYFPFLGANSGNVDHVRLLADNTFGFEDLANGGDRDYNDVTVKVKLSVV